MLAIVVDQFRYDYLTRFRSEYSGGLARLLTKGAVFTNASFIHVPAITAVGHSTILTGATPSISGIVGNDWFDRDEGVRVSSVSDAKTQLLGGSGPGSSPRRLLVSTVGDELKIAGGGKPRVIGVSLKDRAAILPAGHMADGAFWFDVKTGNFVSSTFYYKELPAWAREFNAPRPAEKYRGVTWMGHKMPEDNAKLFAELEVAAFGNELIEAFAECALGAEQLGLRESTDLLTVSFSSNDYVGHRYGPDSPEVHEVALATDRLLERLFLAVERQVGAGNYLAVLTADHGVAPTPEVNLARRMPGGRIDPASIRAAVQGALVKKYGAGEWVAGSFDQEVYLNQGLIAQLKLDLGEVEREAARAIQALPHVSRVYTLQQMIQGGGVRDMVSQKVSNGFHLRRGPDVLAILDPYWIVGTGTGTSHGSPYSYDAHVPVIFLGAGIRPGQYHGAIAVNDIAPTLATMLEIETPSGSIGRVLTEMLVN
ncbi:MAG: alkaline phosphatase family protein [Candidatus Solibacter sp.]|nr:alkaline phosphatase family protein [Candidatus Solibacter sp.]